jgi:Fe-S-cluster containining protein
LAGVVDDAARDDLEAGDFSAWLEDLRAALRGEAAAAVPCGGCTACCRSSQFVLIEADEHETLEQIPAELVVPAPLMPAGNFVLGYREDGSCPMLGEKGCTIYEHRPRACRSYDCRVFTATGLLPEGQGRAEVARRTQRWRFSFADGEARLQQAALRRAAAYLRSHRDIRPAAAGHTDVTQMAALAVVVCDLFLDVGADPDPARVRTELERRTSKRP